MKLLVVLVTSLGLLAACREVLNEDETNGALAVDDTCALGEDCDLSLRQLRGLRQEGRLEQHPDAPAQHDPVTLEEEDSNATDEEEEQPQFNYNWNFGCSSEEKEPPASDGMQFNMNWNFCFDDDAMGSGAGGGLQMKQGDCSVFGCTATFDFKTLMNSCQCFPGCNMTFLGNTCCPDFHDHCEAGGSKATPPPPTALELVKKDYTTYASAACSSLHGAVVQQTVSADLKSCARQCSGNAECSGFSHSLSHQCKLLAAINIPGCATEDGWSTFVKINGKKPPICRSYMANTGCSWTNKWNCPGQTAGLVGAAGADGSEGYNCCCNLGLWKSSKIALPSGTPLRIINKFSNRALFAKPDRYWEDGCGAGTPIEKVHDDGVWTLIPREEGLYRIVNQRSNRALYAKKGENWEAGWGAGTPSKVTEDGLWRIVEDPDGGVHIINFKSERALYAKAPGPGEYSWSLGVGAGYPPKAVTKDGVWHLAFLM